MKKEITDFNKWVKIRFGKEIQKAIRRHKTYDLETLSALEYDIYETSLTFIFSTVIPMVRKEQRKRISERVLSFLKEEK